MQKALYQEEKKVMDKLVGKNVAFFEELESDDNMKLWKGYNPNKTSLENYQDSKGILRAKFKEQRKQILKVKKETQLL